MCRRQKDGLDRTTSPMRVLPAPEKAVRIMCVFIKQLPGILKRASWAIAGHNLHPDFFVPQIGCAQFSSQSNKRPWNAGVLLYKRMGKT